jgi:hypothetical protein
MTQGAEQEMARKGYAPPETPGKIESGRGCVAGVTAER